MATASDLAMLEAEELEGRLYETRRELFNLRFQLATGQLDNTSRLGQVRRDVARLLTVLREREIAEAEGTYVAPSTADRDAARAHLAAEDEAAEQARHRAREGAEQDGTDAGAEGDAELDEAVEAGADDDGGEG